MPRDRLTATVAPLTLVALVATLASLGVGATAADARKSAKALAAEVERLCTGRTLWPGFEPLEVPLAVYDGKLTYLFRHPQPPFGFVAQKRYGRTTWLYDGRFPDLVANTSATINGVETATVLLADQPPERSLTDLAAMAIHEAFHVYQRENHPDWQGDEGELFTYPSEDASLLVLRRTETRALSRALAAGDREAAACWTRRALAARGERFARLGAGPAGYERGTELNEGLATYVELRAAGRAGIEVPESGFGAEAVRERSYETGAALALLLDRLAPDWKESLGGGEASSLDEALAAALGDEEAGTAPACAWTDDERQEIGRRADADVAALLERRAERRQAFERLPGWQVVVEAAEGSPLWVRGFDPVNVERVEAGVLHTRFLELGNDAARVELLNGQALTEAAGAHPLFDGARRVVVAGLAEPAVTEQGTAIAVRAPGLTAEFSAARLERGERRLIVRLAAPAD